MKAKKHVILTGTGSPFLTTNATKLRANKFPYFLSQRALGRALGSLNGQLPIVTSGNYDRGWGEVRRILFESP